MQNVSLAVQHRTVSLFGHTDDDFTNHFHDKDVTRHRLPYDLKLYWLIDEQIHSGARTFITGLRDGVDTMLAAYVLDCRRAMPEKGIRLHVVLAYEGQADESYAKRVILEQANSCDYIGEVPTPANIQQQARKMVDLSTHVLAVRFDPVPEKMMVYAAIRGVEVLVHWPQEIMKRVLYR